jgi:acetate kinase
MPRWQAAKLLGKPEAETNLVICHLGAGSSMCAVQVGGRMQTGLCVWGGGG